MINERIEETHAYYATNRSALLKLIRGTPMSVLELGCGAGALIKKLKNSGCDYVCGIEIREDVALEALKHSGADKIVVANIETDVLDFEPESFDLIIASHVLEHMIDPWKVTKQLAGWLKPGGQFIGALPNVRHLRVIWPLFLRGTWAYEETGILDWTHLRFFTRVEIVKLIKSAHLEVEGVFPEIDGPKSELLRVLSFGLLTDFAAYAYNFSAWKR